MVYLHQGAKPSTLHNFIFCEYITSEWREKCLAAGSNAANKSSLKEDFEHGQNKQKDAIFAIVVTMLAGVFALTACNIGGLSLEQRIDVAGQSAYTMQNGGNPTTADIDALLAELAALRTEVERLQGDNAALLAQIDKYTSQLNDLRNEGNQMEQGTFITLQEAYERDLITRNDIKHIVYFMNGEAPLNQGAVMEFEPQITMPTLSGLNAGIASAMKYAFVEFHRQELEKSLTRQIEIGMLPAGTTILSTISIHSFLGEFDGSFAVRMTSSMWEYDMGSSPKTVAGLEWQQFPPVILVFAHSQIK